MPACLFRDFQHVLKVALNGCFQDLCAGLFQVPNTEAHQRRRREHDGQLQRQECLRAFVNRHFLSISQPRQFFIALTLARL